MHISAQTKYKVTLTQEEQITVTALIGKGTAKARTITRARILLLTHNGNVDKTICAALGVVRSVVYDTRKHYVEGGLQRALFDLPHKGAQRKLSGKEEAQVVAIACSKAPKGYTRWTLDLLTEAVKKTVGVSIGRTAICKVLLRNDTKPWLKKMWCIPKVTPEFLARMDDVLEVYEEVKIYGVCRELSNTDITFLLL